MQSDGYRTPNLKDNLSEAIAATPYRQSKKQMCSQHKLST